MKNSKVIKFIIQLPEKERIRFKEYLHSPFFNKQETLIKLWLYLHKKLKKTPLTIDKQKLFKSLFPKKPYNDQVLKNLMSTLMQHLITFMGIQQYTKAPIRNHIDALEYALNHRMHTFIDFNKKRALKLLGDDQPIDVKKELYLTHLYELFCSKDLQTQNKIFDEESVLKHLEQYQIIKQLKVYCEIFSDREKRKKAENHLVGKQLKHHIGNNASHLLKHPLISLYYKILTIYLSEYSDETYQAIKEELNEVKLQLVSSEIEEIYNHLEGFCLLRINLGASTAQSELFELYKTQLKLPGLQISESKYRNIAIIGCRLNQLDWVTKFLEQRKMDLHPNNRENAYLFNLAAVETYQKNYDKALEYLNQIELTSSFYYESVKYALIKIYYKLESFDTLNYTLESFRIYILRNKNRMEKNRTIATSNFIKIVEKLVKYQTSPISKKELSKKLEDLQKKIEETTLLMNKDWLLNQLI